VDTLPKATEVSNLAAVRIAGCLQSVASGRGASGGGGWPRAAEPSEPPTDHSRRIEEYDVWFSDRWPLSVLTCRRDADDPNGEAQVSQGLEFPQDARVVNNRVAGQDKSRTCPRHHWAVLAVSARSLLRARVDAA
jgi:hypothetical protein